jgi:hypothetical protein
LARGLGSVGRLAGGTVATGAAAYGAYQDIQDAQHGRTATAIGGLAGAAIGGVGGFMLGGPLGAAIGASLVGYLGRELGGLFERGEPEKSQTATALTEQATVSAASNDTLSRLLAVTETGVQYLADISRTHAMSPSGGMSEQLIVIAQTDSRLLDVMTSGVGYLSQIAQATGSNLAGPNSPNIGIAQQASSLQSSSIDVLSRILNMSEMEVGYLAQIKAELSRQTTYLTGTPSPAGAPALGMGLQASVSSIASGRADPSYPYTTIPF